MNRLAHSISPYLLQHKDNPVDWWPWGAEALAESARRDVPVLLSVGYAACHWCHVMAHESFEDPQTAALMNANFVSIKVDREERPDVDSAYMAAVQAMTGQGGWPMTAFLTSDGRPFYAGTYFPPRPMRGRQSFPQVLAAISATWRDRRADLEDAATRLTEGMRHAAESAAVGPGVGSAVGPDVDPTAGPTARPAAGPTGGPTTGPAARPAAGPDAEVSSLRDVAEPLLAAAVQTLLDAEDRRFAGFGGAPKFPPSTTLEFLLRRGVKDQAAADLAGRTLRAMAYSGMYDQLGGGFARYAVDRAWVVPHFEKMLYDNALLARVYLHWWRLTGEPTGARIALETCAWMLAELGTPDGALASSLDADTAGHEGLTYVWSPAELAEVLSAEDAVWIAELLGVSAQGTLDESRSTLRLTREIWGGPEEARWIALRGHLLDARALRPQPDQDGKLVAAWNGLAVAALAETGALLRRPDLIQAAERMAGTVWDRHIVRGTTPSDGIEPRSSDLRLRRVSLYGSEQRQPEQRRVVSSAAAVLEDYADLAEGFLTLHAVTGRPSWRERAGELLDVVLEQFYDGQGHFYDTAADALDPALAALGRSADPADQPCPSGTAAALGALLTYGAVTGSHRHREVVELALSRLAPAAGLSPRFFGWTLAVLEAWVDGPLEATILSAGDSEGSGELVRTVLLGVAPGLAVSHDDSARRTVPVERAPRGSAADRTGSAAGPAAVICRDFTCSLPLSDLGVVADAVDVRISRISPPPS